MLVTRLHLVRRAPSVLQQQQRTAATATPARRTWTAYKKATPTPTPTPTTTRSAPASATASAQPTAQGDQVQISMEDLIPEMEMEPPSSAQPLPPPPTSTRTSPSPASSLASSPLSSLSTQLAPSYPSPSPSVPQQQQEIDWSTSFHGISSQPFSTEQAATLMRPLVPSEIEIKPDGLLYLPEILYRRILNQAFGPGGWGMVPRGEMTVMKGLVTREWGLVAGGRLISLARGEQTYFDPSGLPTATEGCKSNALMRCCKDLGIASELWDPAFIRTFKAQHCVEAWTEHGSTKKKQKRWRKKGNKFEYPLKEAS
ncbi:mitochondrial genome maintenance MGM101-domain-containing protein [Leucosporidium creatinivorum]|uniref:Mitochondrial genome maintenance protein MGM101 n=1 Tax=Leucosporidium creatinivorum TaxID=106004 RepID=A0A1Y2G235_9BASI|nr:mitochondrial genome maintenance MGM101-domain-containing protein [Leucosporidium creatinivorum]